MTRLGLAAFAALAQGQVHQSFKSQMSFIIKTLTDAKAEIEDMKHQEEVQHSAYATHCSTTQMNTEEEVDTLKKEIEESQATMETEAAKGLSKATEAKELAELIAQKTAELEAATKEREQQHTDFTALNTDYTESIDAVKKAVNYLQSGNLVVKESDTPAELMQTAVKYMGKDMSPSLRLALLQQPTSDGVVWQKDSSNTVIDMLQKLEDKFTAERSAIQKTENSQQSAFLMVKGTLDSEITGAEHGKESATEASKNHEANSQAAETSKVAQKASKSTAETMLRELISQCKAAAALFGRRMAGQTKDIEAFGQAIDILSNKKEEFIQTGKISLIQLHHQSDNSARLRRAQELLRHAASKHGDKVLMQLATSQDPFQKVTDLIRELIGRLQAEAAQEQGEQAWCSAHMDENQKDRDERSATVEKTTTRIAKLGAEIEIKTKQVSDTQAASTKLEGEVAEARKIRMEERNLFEQTKGELETMEKNFDQAIVVLENAGTALLQINQPAYEATEDYVSQGGSIIALIENLKTQTVKELTEKEADEATANNAFMRFEGDTKATLKEYEVQIDMTKTAIANAKEEKESSAAELTDATALLDEANQYYESLQEKCVHAMSHEERAKARQEEIASLEQALAILEGN